MNHRKAIAGLSATASFLYLGYQYKKEILRFVYEQKLKFHPGNGNNYAVINAGSNPDTILTGKTIGYLGSSVTFGAASGHVSFVEYIARRNRGKYVKEAVSGTTLVDEGEDSYIRRMKKMDPDTKFDAFVVQLSTNDATQNKKLGTISQSGLYDTKTITGAMEYIISYVKNTWHCPVLFYTNARYESEAYAAMVQRLKELQKKHVIGVIDLYTDDAFNDITDEQRNLYMADPIHPAKAGYLQWWTPEIEKQMISYLDSLYNE